MADRRQVARVLHDREHVKKLFDDIGPRFADRAGGYLRIVKLGPRQGDGAETAALQFVDYDPDRGAPAAEADDAKKAKGKAKGEGEGEEKGGKPADAGKSGRKGKAAKGEAKAPKSVPKGKGKVKSRAKPQGRRGIERLAEHLLAEGPSRP